MSSEESPSCANCGKCGDSLKSCSACKMVKYCNAECQKSHRPKHKKECQLFKQPPPNEDCPVCMLPMPLMGCDCKFLTCCGNWICSGCDYGVKISSSGKDGPCVMCRSPSTETSAESIERCKARMDVGDAGAFYFLGCQYNKGEIGMPIDKTKALELWTRAAELGNKIAHCTVGEAYLCRSEEFGVPKNLIKAIHHFQIGAIQGEAMSRFYLGKLESTGTIPRASMSMNIMRALRHFSIAAASGHKDSLDTIRSAYSNGKVTKEEFASSLRAYQAAHDGMRSIQRDQVAEARERYRKGDAKEFSIPVHEYFVEPVYRPSALGYLAELCVPDDEVMEQARSRGIDPESHGYNKPSSNEPTANWRPQNGRLTFMGSVTNPLRGKKKLDNPMDFLKYKGGRNFDDICPGHYMTNIEMMIEFNHCDDSDGSFLLDQLMAKDISKYLVDFRDKVKRFGTDEMYPFHLKLKSPFTGSPPPKVRSGDTIEVMTKTKMDIFGFNVDPGTPFQMHIISLTSAGIATGMVETNKEVYFAYFPIYHAKRLVNRGINWTGGKASCSGDAKGKAKGKAKAKSSYSGMKDVPTKPHKKKGL